MGTIPKIIDAGSQKKPKEGKNQNYYYYFLIKVSYSYFKARCSVYICKI